MQRTISWQFTAKLPRQCWWIITLAVSKQTSYLSPRESLQRIVQNPELPSSILNYGRKLGSFVKIGSTMILDYCNFNSNTRNNLSVCQLGNTYFSASKIVNPNMSFELI